MDTQYFVSIGIFLILLGFLVLLSAIIISIVSGRSSTAESEIKGGGVVFIGPIPLIFGTDKGTVTFVVILAIILMVLYYLVFGRASP